MLYAHASHDAILRAKRARLPTWVEYTVAVGRKGAAGAADVSTDMFLGHLCPIDEYRVYGYMTSTRLKLLAVLEDVNDIREPELKRVSTSRGAVRVKRGGWWSCS